MSAKIKIVIADSHDLLAEGLSYLLATSETEITAIVKDGKQLTDLMYANYHDVILLDLHLPGINSLNIITTLKRQCPSIKIIIFATYDEEHFIEKAKAKGADGYLLKNVDKGTLLQTIKAVYNGAHLFPTKNDITHPLLTHYNLTKRENELLEFIKNSKTNQQIADNLHVSLYTVKAHRKNILQKLQLKNSIELKHFIADHNL